MDNGRTNSYKIKELMIKLYNKVDGEDPRRKLKLACLKKIEQRAFRLASDQTIKLLKQLDKIGKKKLSPLFLDYFYLRLKRKYIYE